MEGEENATGAPRQQEAEVGTSADDNNEAVVADVLCQQDDVCESSACVDEGAERMSQEEKKEERKDIDDERTSGSNNNQYASEEDLATVLDRPDHPETTRAASQHLKHDDTTPVTDKIAATVAAIPPPSRTTTTISDASVVTTSTAKATSSERSSTTTTLPGAVSVHGRDSTNMLSRNDFQGDADGVVSSSTAAVAGVDPNIPHSQSETQQEEPQQPQNSLLVEAELVAPPIQAVSVVIDEEQPHPDRALVEQHAQQQRGGENENSHDDDDDRHKTHSSRLTRNQWLLIIGVLCLLNFAIIVPAVMIAGRKNNEDDDEDELATTPPTESITTPTFDYPCFTSTEEMLWAQLSDLEASNFTKTKDLYIICPGTHIKIGTFTNPAKNDYTIINGDQPLIAVANDTVIQCGLDGHRNNSCVLDGGFVQVIMQTQLASIDRQDPRFREDFWWTNMTVHNVTFRGLTFTGVLESAGTLAGVSFLYSQAGNVTVEDCRWTELTASSTVVAIGQNVYQASEAGGFEEVPTQSAALTVRNCQFDNLTYDHPIFHVDDQILHVEHTIFENLSVSVLPDISCNGWELGGCASVLDCVLGSECSVSNSCFTNVEILGLGMFYFDEDESVVAPGTNNGSASTVADRLLTFNNYMDNSSFVPMCEVVLLGISDALYDDDVDLDASVCYDGLAFEADQCQLQKLQ